MEVDKLVEGFLDPNRDRVMTAEEIEAVKEITGLEVDYVDDPDGHEKVKEIFGAGARVLVGSGPDGVLVVKYRGDHPVGYAMRLRGLIVYRNRVEQALIKTKTGTWYARIKWNGVNPPRVIAKNLNTGKWEME